MAAKSRRDHLLFLVVLLLNFTRNGVSQSQVRNLPGFLGPLPFHLETGYVNIDENDDIQLFYYFFKSENNPVVDPLIIWFTGGPGCSGLSAILYENGPVAIKVVEYNGSIPTLELNPFSWTKVYNMVFIDAPVGTGFSYSRTIESSYSTDTISGQQGYIFIKKWLRDHPEFISNRLYVAGDSYSGKVVPIVVQDASNGIKAGDEPLVNLQGYLLGNPITYRDQERNYGVPYSHGKGLISNELFESLKINCRGNYVDIDPDNVECSTDIQAYTKCIEGLPTGHILEPKCAEITPELKEILGIRISHNILVPVPDPDLPCNYIYRYMLSFYWANDDRVQKALNVRKGKTKKWLRCRGCGINYTHNVENSISDHVKISKTQRYRSLIYNGDKDLVVPFLSTQAWIKSLNYSIKDDWRPWLMDSQVVKYTRTYANNMTFATVLGAGHLALEFKPEACLEMLKRWLSHEPL
ncbi:sinapoylglucose--choline O-sinapoyltransferase [Ranunculus cassubicifolius]